MEKPLVFLDTCAILWLSLKPGKLSKPAAKILKQNESRLALSNISFWEIAVLKKLKRVKFEIGYLDFMDLFLKAYQPAVFGITPEIADISVNFSEAINKDPADRIICAAAIFHKAVLVTADKNLRKSKEIKTVW